VTDVQVSETTVWLPCPPGQKSKSGKCADDFSVNVATTATDPENDVLTYNYTVSGGRIVGQGANVTWDMSGVRAGTYTITAGVDDGCGICGQTQTRTIEVRECDDCEVILDCQCPQLSVTGPAEVVRPGQSMTFTANATGGNQEITGFNWTVSQGTITSGQGTSSITVDTTGLEDTTITATVTITGTNPACTCDTEADATGVVAALPKAVPIDEFTGLSNDDVRQRLDAFFSELQNYPDNTGYIIIYGPPRQVTARERLIRNHIAFRQIDASRIVIVQGGEEAEVRVRLLRVPPGADPPTP
jgi:hypothetical protein